MRGSSAFSFLRSVVVGAVVCFGLTSAVAHGQAAPVMATPAPLITQPLDEARLSRLAGNTHPLARTEFDLGTAPASLPLERMLLVLKRSAVQESALRKLLDDQQDKASPNYHKWLTPETFGEQFGPTDIDIQTITSWLQSHGFQVGSTKGRTVLEFSGTAGQVQEVFHTTIHKYLVNGEQHWANASDPMIPTALTPAVAGIESLNNFPRKAMNVPGGRFTRDKKTGRIHSTQPQITFPGGCIENNLGNDPCAYGLTPYDFATIYNVLPLWNAGIDGTGVTIAIVGETDIQMSDVESFRSFFGLPANDPTFILNGPDPGIQGDESEADIDVQWSGGVAKGATIDFVISQSTETTAGTDLSAVYIVDQNLAPIMSESYGECELGLGMAGNQFYNALWQQASAQGITVFISAGDAGSAGCDNFDAQSPAPARYGLQVSGYASTPYNVAVGGTDFNDFSNPATYWSPNNNPTTQESALSYIPETTWNDSCTNGLFATIGYSSNAESNCNNSRLTPYFDVPLGGSGGVSACTTPSGSTPGSCAGGYTKPTWQMGSGVPADGKRDIPDVSLFASNGFLGQAYLICQADQNGDCPSSFLGFGGTSVSSPAFAGIMALINQKTGERQGNANYVFYKLAAKPGASCTSGASEASDCIFNDVAVGTNAGPCTPGTQNCVTNNAGDAYGVLSGYNAGTGYDLATGLGSVNANNLVNAWVSAHSSPSTTTLSSVTPTTITHGQALNFTVTVKPQSGSGTPTGEISLSGPTTINSTSQGIAGFNLSNGTVTGSTELLPGGTYSLTAHYPGDANYAASDSAGISVTVGKENSQPQVFLVTFGANGNIISGNTNTAVYGSPYLLRVNVENSAEQMCAPAAASGATECPSGKVTLTNNGSALDAGTFALNSYGYFEDQAVQLPGGTNSVKVAYAGDNSFKASTVTSPITITPATTSVTIPTVFGAAVGQSVSIAVTVLPSLSNVASPSGTVTFYANGNVIGGSVAYTSGFSDNPYLNATLTSNTNAFTSAGSYAITATYNGDANYSSSTSQTQSITVKYPTPSVAVNPYNQTVDYGATASITVLVDTTNKSVYPTGTVTLVNNGTVAGPLTCANAKDASGNFACQVTATFTVTAGGSIQVNYSGDANYPTSSNSAYINMPDFMFSTSGGIQVTAGQSQTLTVTFTSLSGLSGTVGNFVCSNLPAETTCSFSPTQVALPSNGTASTTLTVTTTTLGQSRKGLGFSAKWASNWEISGFVLVLGLCLVGIPRPRQRMRVPVALILTALLILLPSCGGGGGGDGVRNPVPSITSLSPTQIAAGSQVQNLYITGANFMSSSTVTYNGTLHNSSLQSPTQLQVALGPSDVAATGQYPVVVSNPAPGGGSSTAVNFAIVTGTPTGYFTPNLNATIGPITHSTQLSMQIQ
jgi:subtilase family serine protease